MVKQKVDDPQGPRSAPQKVAYGAKGLKTGVPKDQQARNQDGGAGGPGDGPTNDPNGPQSPLPAPADPNSPLSYLGEAQQARVTKLLGDSYDPSKPLNEQLFRARWAQATPEQRRVIAKNVSGQFLEGGPTSKSLAGFHSEYLDILKEENAIKAQDLARHQDAYKQELGGYATTPEQAALDIAHWTAFAATPEGKAHIAQSDYAGDVEGWIASQAASSNEGVQNYAKEQSKYQQIAKLSVALGQAPPGFKPPGWDSTLASIKAGTAPKPGALTMAMYPGVAADLVGIPDITTTELLKNRRDAGLGRANRERGTGSGAAGSQFDSPSTMLYQPLYAQQDAYSADQVSDAPQYV